MERWNHGRACAATLGCVGAATLLAVAGCPTGEPLDLPDDVLQHYQGIVGGQPTQDWPAVGAYLIDGGYGGLCTATLVATDVALTAGHCVDGSGNDDRFFFGYDISDASTANTVWITDAIAHPQFNLNNPHPHDIAVLLLNHEVEDVQYVPVNTTAFDDSWNNRLLHYVGFGSDTYYGGPGAGIKRETDLAIYEYYSLEFLHYTPETNACSGDSGGPAFVDLDGHWYHAGVVSFGVPVQHGQDICSGAGVEMRVDAEINFLDEYLDPTQTPYDDDDDTADDDTDDDDQTPPLEQLPPPQVDDETYDQPGGCACTTWRARSTRPTLGLPLLLGAVLALRRRRG